MSRSKMKKSARSKPEGLPPKKRSRLVRSVTCRETMVEANWVFGSDTMADVLDDLTQNDWDHVFVVNKEGVPMGRIHAVDMLKIVAKKNVERSVAWMLSIPANIWFIIDALFLGLPIILTELSFLNFSKPYSRT